MQKFIILDEDDVRNLVDGKEVIIRMDKNELISVVTEETYERIMNFKDINEDIAE